jgi:hypothetical protein
MVSPYPSRLVPQIARTTAPVGYRYDPKMSEKADSGFVGIRNPGCICYMNSLMQQVRRWAPLVVPVRWACGRGFVSGACAHELLLHKSLPVSLLVIWASGPALLGACSSS